MNKKGQLSKEEIKQVVMEMLKGQKKGNEIDHFGLGNENKSQLSDEDVTLITSLF
ncbi:hypothetical protein ACLMAB_21385 [Brevibacillus laterosporus]